MKFRRLSAEELEHFREDFVKFLVVNGLDAGAWEKLKEEDKDKADKLINIFSDHVFETVLKKTEYLLKVTPHRLFAFQCLKDRMVMVTLETEADLEKISVQEAAGNASTHIYHSSKPYISTREEEIFKMIMKGCEIDNGDMFKKLALLLAE